MSRIRRVLTRLFKARRPAKWRWHRLPLRLETLEARDVPAATPSIPSLSAAWAAADIGAPALTGFSGQLTPGQWTVQGAGTGLGGTADQLHLAYRDLTGDGTLV